MRDHPASPQAFEGVRNRFEQASHGHVLHFVQHIARAANLPDVVKNGDKFPGKSPGPVTQERHYSTTGRVYMWLHTTPQVLWIWFDKPLKIIIEVSVNGYISMNYIAAVQLITGIGWPPIILLQYFDFQRFWIVETAGFAAVCRDLPPGTDETGKRIVKPYKSMNYENTYYTGNYAGNWKPWNDYRTGN